MIDTNAQRYGADENWLNCRINEFWADAAQDAGDAEAYECSDNYRLACKQVEGEMSEYEQAQFRGCCGSVDVEFGPSPEGKTYVYGFNYGH